ncbi:MAG: ATP-grasp domain-containing protein [Bdellovibrio sp.]|nr:ATP-grasp domain-containing protein [Bdellovibrio sp.]
MAIKVLVANRAEIACRIFQTCREMGLKTIGVFTPEDRHARHIAYADEVYQIPSYLDIDAIIQIASQARAKLIHPGYGFLSERSQFVDAIEKQGFIFIGPTSVTMKQMGDKIFAKEIAKQVKIPIIPGVKVLLRNDLKLITKKLGFPLLIKAAAGGGGKGMRIVRDIKDLELAAENATKEAQAFFGDGTIFIEKYIENPRHIEIQVFGDGRGNGVHLYERECSLQRRHQKIWEEALAPNLNTKIKENLRHAAIKLVQKVKYRNAGAVEFLIDKDENFYFLEMNTRLQVEHPVTELITGVDLVHAQLSQALNGKSFFFKQGIPLPRGHAIGVRLYAEDPYREFMPTPGKIEILKWPQGTGIRVDSGIEEGQRLGTQFDSLLAKLVVYAENRDRALERMKFALKDTVILGIGTNQNYLKNLCDHPKVEQGKVYTNFLETEFVEFLNKHSDMKKDFSRVILANYPSPWVDRSETVSYREKTVTSNTIRHKQTTENPPHTSELEVQFPGKVRKILVKKGDYVQRGEVLLLVEAMKMEFAIKAPYSATIKELFTKEGQQINIGDRYLNFELVQ